MAKGLFITGTDTGVGKTVVTCALATKLRMEGRNVGVMKPVLTGADEHPNDVERLVQAAKVSDPLELVCPYQFHPLVAPQIAAQRDGVTIDKERIRAAYDALHARHEIMLVEGIGGVMVPISPKFFVLDLIRSLELPALIVARCGLGTINHSLLTINALRDGGVSIAGIVINQPRHAPDAAHEESGVTLISEVGGIRVLGDIRHIEAMSDCWEEAMERHAQSIRFHDCSPLL